MRPAKILKRLANCRRTISEYEKSRFLMNDNWADTGPSNWASGSEVSSEAMTKVQSALPVQLIATPRSVFKKCRAEDDLERVVGENAKRDAPFDNLPVVDGADGGRETITGLLDLTRFVSGRNQQGERPQGAVKDRMDSLSEEFLIGADASILDFVRAADQHPCRLVVSGVEVSGLVTLSDLQKLPVRAALFAAVTHAEMAMRDAVHREFNGSEEWTKLLWENRQKKVRAEKRRSIADNTFVNSLLFTTFYEKMRIIYQSPKFGKFEWSQEEFNEEMQSVKKLRNDLAHSKNYASTLDDAKLVCQAVKSIDLWVPRLVKFP